MDLEKTIVTIITHSGDARSLLMSAIKSAKEGKHDEAKGKIKEASEKIHQAHKVQTSLIHKEAQGEELPVTLLLVHAQDHLMTAVTIKDLATELVDIYRNVVKS